MGYVAVQGGLEAIQASNDRLQYERIAGRRLLEVEVVQHTLTPLIDQVMSESSLYDEELAALAIKQGGGSMEEAVFLLRAHRSTLPRLYYTEACETDRMFVTRRISSAFKDIPGGQLLGTSRDYSQRFLNFDLQSETEMDLMQQADAYENTTTSSDPMDLKNLPKVADYLVEEGLYRRPDKDDAEPQDITKESLSFPATRSQRLQVLTRGQTGAVTSLAYADLRAFGAAHPTIGELRVGWVELYVESPFTGEESYYLGAIRITEVESINTQDEKDDTGKTLSTIQLGYGCCFGQNESKAIGMSILDACLTFPAQGNPLSDEEFVLMSIDSLESTGFVSHLKLPHYVTFQSKLDALRRMREGSETDGISR